MQPQLFDFSIAIPEPSAAASQGLGTGLAIVGRLMRLMGGSVACKAQAPVRAARSRCACRSPSAETARVRRADAARDRQPRCSSSTTTSTPPMRSARCCDLNGFDVETAHDPDAAMERAIAIDPDVMLLDIGLPGMTGYELARKFSAHPVVSRAKLIALTGYGAAGRHRTGEGRRICRLSRQAGRRRSIARAHRSDPRRRARTDARH